MVAARAMRGPADDASVAAPTAVALPLSARNLLSALARNEPASLREVLARVTAVVAGSDSVSRWRRAIPIVLGGAPLGVSLLIVLMWLPAIAQVMRTDVWPIVDCLMRLSKIEQQKDLDSRRQRDVLEVYVAGRFGSRLTDDALWGKRAFAGLRILRPLAQRALANHPSVSIQELAAATTELQAALQEGARNRREILGVFVAFPSIMLVLATGVGLLSALAFRGGALLRALGVAIVTRDGAEVSRWRASWRASLTWSPVWLLCLCLAASSLAGRSLDDVFTAPWIVGDTASPLSKLLCRQQPRSAQLDRETGCDLRDTLSTYSRGAPSSAPKVLYVFRRSSDAPSVRTLWSWAATCDWPKRLRVSNLELCHPRVLPAARAALVSSA